MEIVKRVCVRCEGRGWIEIMHGLGGDAFNPEPIDCNTCGGTGVDEDWRPVIEWEELFEISNVGRVRRLCEPRLGRFLRGSVDVNGYARVTLSHGGRQQTYFLHRLVAFAFIGSQPEGCEINHRDGRKLNNFVENLEWITPKANTAHAWAMGLITPHGSNTSRNRGTSNPISRLTPDDVLIIFHTWLPHKVLAEQYEVSDATVSDIKRGKTWGWLTSSHVNTSAHDDGTIDCPVCRGSGKGTVYSAPQYTSHIAGSERPDGITADGIRGRA